MIIFSDEGGMVDDVQPCKSGEQPTLHEILMAEKLDFEAKVQRAARRKKWLKGNFLPVLICLNIHMVFMVNLYLQRTRRYCEHYYPTVLCMEHPVVV